MESHPKVLNNISIKRTVLFGALYDIFFSLIPILCHKCVSFSINIILKSTYEQSHVSDTILINVLTNRKCCFSF